MNSERGAISAAGNSLSGPAELCGRKAVSVGSNGSSEVIEMAVCQFSRNYLGRGAGDEQS